VSTKKNLPAYPGETTTAARPGRVHRAVDAIDERMGIKALGYPVPEHANNLSSSLGGLTAVSLVILLVPGIYLAQFYMPMPEDANQSVRHLVTSIWLGGFARALHVWAAQAMFVLVLLHMLRVFFHASYRKPREGNWLIGTAMFLLAFLAIFTGTVIKSDQEAYEALAHNLDVAKLLGGAPRDDGHAGGSRFVEPPMFSATPGCGRFVARPAFRRLTPQRRDIPVWSG